MNTQRRHLLVNFTVTAATTQLFGCGLLPEEAMKPSNSAEKLRRFLAARGFEQSRALAPELVSAGIEFYKSVRCSGLASNPQADMLLVQWGVFDWGKGENFEFDLTRQFIDSSAFGDDAISQLRFTAYYPSSPVLRSIEKENRWCQSLADVVGFENFIRGSSAFVAVSSLPPSRLMIEWGPV